MRKTAKCELIEKEKERSMPQLSMIIIIIFFLFIYPKKIFTAEPIPHPAEVKSLYLSTQNLFNKKKIAELERIISETDANGIVIDFKDSNNPKDAHLRSLVERFRTVGAYTIARIVTFQDTVFAKKYPDIAIKTRGGYFWYSGRAVWKRYWLDPASVKAQEYNIAVAKRAIDAGFNEVQFDYIRFPTDGNMKNIVYPVFDPSRESKVMVMQKFFERLHRELKNYSPNTLLGIDLFGEVFVYGKEAGIGQSLDVISSFFDVVSPMAYPSHYKCGEFKVRDPNAHPYLVYKQTIKNGLKFLGQKKIIIRPWIQSFSLRNIYGCGPSISYTAQRINSQIQASLDLGVRGFMLWNVSNNYPNGVFAKK